METAATLIWLLSAAGILNVDGTPVEGVPFKSADVIAGDARGDRIAVIVGGRQVWVREDGEWTKWVDADLTLNCLHWIDDKRLLVGTERARLAWLDKDGFRFVESFDKVEGREDWNTPWGGPPDTRSIAVATDGTIYVNIHVGWIVRSRDDGKTWRNLREGLHQDVHMVEAHPRRAEIVFCATAGGFHISHDRGDRFERRTDPMPYYYQRAVACFPDRDVYLCTTSRGPRGGDALLLRSEDEGRKWAIVKGLPDAIKFNINTFQVVTQTGGRALAIVDNNAVFETADYGATWQKHDAEYPKLNAAIVVTAK